MKAFLLAAGQGTRLRPLTDTIPKCLAPIQGVPMLRIWLDLCRVHGITEVLINLHAHADAIREFARQNDGAGVCLRISEEHQLLGSAGTIRANRDWVQDEPFFWIFYADVLTTANLREMLKLHQRCGKDVTLGVYEVAEPERCGIVEIDPQGIIQSFVEKPAVPKSNWAFSGLLIAGQALLDAIPPALPADLGYDVLPKMVGAMAAYRVKTFVMDIGTMENYRKAQMLWPSQLAAARQSQ